MGILLIVASLLCSLNCKMYAVVALPVDSKVVLVAKQQGLLRLIEKKSTGYTTLNEYFISYGQEKGTKLKKDDNKTPEGVYFVKSVIPKEDLPNDKYGVMAAPINYPNPIDKSLHKTGFGIWIHGTDDIEKLSGKNITKGCIILKNTDLTEFIKNIRPMLTPIVIVDRFDEVKLSNTVVNTPYAVVQIDKVRYRVTAGLEKSENVLYERL